MVATVPLARSTSTCTGQTQVIDITDKKYIINLLYSTYGVHVMPKLLLHLAFLPFVYGVVHADEGRDYRNANMLWSDNEDFSQVNVPADEQPDYQNANMLWSDNEDFHRMNTPHLVNWNMYIYKYMSWSDNEESHQVNTPHADPDLVNSNMSWSDNKEFQKY